MALLVHNLAHYLVNAGNDVAVVYTHEAPGPFTAEAMPAVNYEICWARHANALRYIPPVAGAVAGLQKKYFFDIIHGHGPEAFLLPRLALAGRAKFIMTSHYADTWPLRPAGIFKYAPNTIPVRLIHRIETCCEIEACRKAVRVAVFSEWQRQRIISEYKIPPVRVSAIPAVIPLGSFDCRRDEAEKNRILFCGRLVEQKGVDVLLRAMALMAGRGNIRGLQLDIIGDGIERARYERLAGRLGLAQTVRFHGHLPRPQLAPFFRKANVFVLPSRSESLGLALIEALACGVPAVASRAGAVPELFRDKEEAVLVPANDPRLLSDALSGLLADEGMQQALSRRGRAMVERHYEPAQNIEKLIEVYRESLTD